MSTHIRRRLVSAALLCACTVAFASPLVRRADSVGPLGLDNVQCTQLNLSVPVSSMNMNFTGVVDEYNNQSYVTQQILEYSTSQENYTAKYIGDKFNFTNPGYDIAGYLCTPITGAQNGSALQVLVHGVGFDSSYWDLTALAPMYSYVRHAASHGYTTFRYDRLGTGNSSTPASGFLEAQAATEVSILTNILTMLRNTTTVGNTTWNKIVGVGHSYGSAQTQAVSAQTPALYDGVVLTGFSANGSYNANFLQSGAYSVAADTLNATLGGKPRTWLVTGSSASAQQGFFTFPHFAPEALTLARATEQPVTLGSLFTTGAIGGPSNFTGPVQIVTGDKDVPFCGGDCYAVPGAAGSGSTIPGEALKILYPATTNGSVYVPADTGHGINLHYSAPDVFEEIMGFLGGNGL